MGPRIPELDCPPTPDLYWNYNKVLIRDIIALPCHARTTSRESYAALGNAPEVALRDHHRAKESFRVRPSRRELTKLNYQRNREAREDFRKMLFVKAANSGQEEDWLAAIRDAGGDYDATLAVYPVKDMAAFRADRKYLEDSYSATYPYQMSHHRRRRVRPFIPDNYFNVEKILSKLPVESVRDDLAIEDIFDFGQYYEEDGRSDHFMSETASKQKADTPIRKDSRWCDDCKSQDHD